MATVSLFGNPIDVAGTLPAIGSHAPAFTLTANDLSEVTLAAFAGKKKVLSLFPSLDTPTCATSVREFNSKAASVANTVVLCISADLPFAQKRFCGAEGIKNVQTLSAFRHPEFLEQWGVRIAAGPMAGLSARAVIVLDENDIVKYTQLVAEISHEPDYASALAAL